MGALTHAQSQIMGYLISANGNETSGSTAKEIMAATGLSQNTVYTNLRYGVPGVMKCRTTSSRNSDMYYVTGESLKTATIETKPTFTPVEDSVEWAKNPFRDQIRPTVSKEPASDERITQLVNALVTALKDDSIDNRYARIAVAAQSIAIHALTLGKDK